MSTLEEKIDEILELQRSSAMNQELHQQHHDFIKTLIEREQERNDLIKSVKEKVLTLGVWGVIAGIGSVVWYGVKQFLKNS